MEVDVLASAKPINQEFCLTPFWSYTIVSRNHFVPQIPRKKNIEYTYYGVLTHSLSLKNSKTASSFFLFFASHFSLTVDFLYLYSLEENCDYCKLAEPIIKVVLSFKVTDASFQLFLALLFCAILPFLMIVSCFSIKA